MRGGPPQWPRTVACPFGLMPLASRTQKQPANTKRKEPEFRLFTSINKDWTREFQALNELPQPQVDLVLGLPNLKPAPSRVST